MFRARIKSTWTEVSGYYRSHPISVTACSIGDAVLHIFPDYVGGLMEKQLYFFFIHRIHWLDRIIGIILEKSGDEVGLYTRVGYFQIDRTVDSRKRDNVKGEGRGRENLEAFRQLWGAYSWEKDQSEYISCSCDAAMISIV